MLHGLPPQRSGIRLGFTGRAGGVSTGPLASLNLALRGDETPGNLEQNWERVARALDPSWTAAQIALVSQVHGGDVVEVTEPPLGPLQTLGAADALVTRLPDVVLAVRTADCVPVLLEADGVIGAAHAGWRGVAAEVLAATVAAMRDLGARQIHAVIGPHIGQDAYEVGEEVVRGIADTGVPEGVFVVRRARAHVDVGAAARFQLEQLGVQVRRLERCTFSDPAFYSHRRDGDSTGRQAGSIGRRP